MVVFNFDPFQDGLLVRMTLVTLEKLLPMIRNVLQCMLDDVSKPFGQLPVGWTAEKLHPIFEKVDESGAKGKQFEKGSGSEFVGIVMTFVVQLEQVPK